MGPVAIDDEARVGGPGGQPLLVDLPVGQVDGTVGVATGERLGGSDVEEHEPRITGGEGLVGVPAVGLDLEQMREVGDGVGGGR